MNWGEIMNEQKSYKDVMFGLMSYEYLEVDWDGYGAVKVPKEMLIAAWEFLGILIENKICPPSIMLGGSGSIGYYWREEGYIEISIGPDLEDMEGNENLSELYKQFSFLVDKGEDNFFGEEGIYMKDFNKSDLFVYLKNNIVDNDCIKEDYYEYYYNVILNGKKKIWDI